MMKNYTKKVQRSKGSASLHWTGKAILSLVLMILLTAQGFANPKLFQSLSLNYENAALINVLDKMKSESNFNFFYNVNDIEENRLISISAKNTAFEDLLKEISKKANFDYTFNGNQIVLTPTIVAASPEVASKIDQDREVTGLVVDQDGNPLPGANVVVKGTSTGAQTDFDGNFTLQVPEDKNILVVSYVGFKNVEVNVKGKSNIEVQLKPDAGQLDAVVVVGTRGKPRTSFDSPVAVDNFKTKDLEKTGKTTVDQQLMLRVPSYNATEQPVSDAAAHFSPADLRGLFPSRTLVLVNGKRKNASALVYSYVTPGRGEVGVDMKAIPSAALESVEVLRDGAAAQYGSDAIAGVINLVMKEKVDPFINNSFSTTTRGDGEQYQLESGFGANLGENGYVNFTLSHMDSETTQRAGEITSVQDEADYWGIPGAVPDFSVNDLSNFLDRNPGAGFQVGLPEMTITNFAYNLGYTLDEETETEIYSFGTLTDREGSAPQFARVPYWVPGFEAIYPDQDFFLAKMAPQIRDHTFSLGLRTTHNEWNFDLSSTLGKNRIDYYIEDSFNQSFAGASPSNFYNGAHEFSHVVNNLDVNRTFYDTGLEALSVAFGVEHRTENFVTEEGEFASYGDGESPDAQGGRTGSESFGGFSPENASDDYRSNIGFYTDITADITESFLLSGALRYENYSDFGSNVSWKMSSRYKTLDDKLVFRGSVSSGFRAPSLHQVYYTATTTTLTENGVQQNGILDNGNPALRALGIPELDAETSFNLSAGLTYRISQNSGITIDAYQIDVDDRIVLSGQVTATGDANSPIDQTLENVGVGSAGFFLNAIDTRTQGIDIVYTLSNLEFGRGFLSGSLAANFNKTEVQGTNFPSFIENNNLGDALFSREDISRVETWRPREKIIGTLSYEIDKFTTNLSLMYYGSVTYRHPSNPLDDATYGGKTLTDLSVNYAFTDKINFTIGVNNLFDVFPDTFAEAYAGRGGTPQDRNLDFVGRFKYPWQTTQFGIDGTRVFSQLNISF
ncbi:TonB-dependent receptor [Psychroflexus lacisalsi]|jgi:iron complex outermembrane receptor protein|uniref:TonB-dependent receptor n=1 Tax=Psychroflexus lacisalsi TaxID=503928 RepID=A0ABP3VDV8_9FLAO|nr:TonB-dependent receptor [Psychroflexus lacisalsi]MBZ9619265.1 TonB-dependent receptor [Psychroflexus lacisalsi]